MGFIRDIYARTSFRNRLLLLLVVVSLMQAAIAAHTFRSLQARPVDDRVRAQLNANLRASAPVIDAEMKAASERLKEFQAADGLAAAIEAKDVAKLESILASGSDAGATQAGAGGAADGAREIWSGAFVEGPDGSVIAGVRPDGILLEQDRVTNLRVVRPEDGALLGSVHVPVVVDEVFMDKRLGSYVEGEDMTVFIADDSKMVTSDGIYDSPRNMRRGLDTTDIRGTKSLVLVQGVLDGRVRIGAAIPTKAVAAAKRRSMSSIMGFVFVLTMMTLIESVAISRAVSDALQRFVALARQLASGKLDRRIPVIGTDEVAELSASFNQMAGNLQERIDGLIEARAQMKRQVELFGEALANATETDDMLDAVCALAMESTGSTHARFWTIDEDGHFRMSACKGLRASDTEPSTIEREVTVRNAHVRSSGTPSWLVVPVRADDRISGLLTLVNANNEFSEDDVRIAGRLGVQAAVALDNARMHAQLRLQATCDGLTGLPNHRSLQDSLAEEIERSARTGDPLGLAMFDIDNFKRINDTYGHGIGDEAIKALARVISGGVGAMGVAARLGGEEFVVLLPGCDTASSTRIADRLREDVTGIEVPLEDGGVLRFTASIGVANIDQNPGHVDNAMLLHQADVGLYNAKRSGKNKVCVAGPDTVTIEMTDAERQSLAARERGEAIGDAA